MIIYSKPRIDLSTVIFFVYFLDVLPSLFDIMLGFVIGSFYWLFLLVSSNSTVLSAFKISI